MDIFTTVDVDLTVFDPQPMWLPLFDAPNSPAIHLTPLDWTQYDFCSRICSVAGTGVVNPRTMLRQLLSLTKADDWRGFVRRDEPIPFDVELCFDVLRSTPTLGVAFDTRLKNMALKGKQTEDAARKNSNAGDGTPSTDLTARSKRGRQSASNA